MLKINEPSGQNSHDFFYAIILGTRDFGGCQCAELHRSKQDPAVYMLIEKWASPADFDDYMAWRKRWGEFDALISNLADAPVIEQFDVANV